MSSPSSVLWACGDVAAVAAVAVLVVSSRRPCGSSRRYDIRLAQRAPAVVVSVEPLVDALSVVQMSAGKAAQLFSESIVTEADDARLDRGPFSVKLVALYPCSKMRNKSDNECPVLSFVLVQRAFFQTEVYLSFAWNANGRKHSARTRARSLSQGNVQTPSRTRAVLSPPSTLREVPTDIQTGTEFLGSAKALAAKDVAIYIHAIVLLWGRQRLFGVKLLACTH